MLAAAAASLSSKVGLVPFSSSRQYYNSEIGIDVDVVQAVQQQLNTVEHKTQQQSSHSDVWDELMSTTHSESGYTSEDEKVEQAEEEEEEEEEEEAMNVDESCAAAATTLNCAPRVVVMQQQQQQKVDEICMLF
jgi:myo-inositol-1-phosphate synthase